MIIVFLILGIIFPLLIIILSYFSSKYSLFNNVVFRIFYLITGAVFVAGGIIVLPIIEQPRITYLLLRIVIGGIIALIGIIGRIIPLLYLKKKGTNPNLENPNELIITGPYAYVRHPQYSAGIIFLIGWFFAWGGIYSLIVLPFVLLVIYIQAIIEEKYILQKKYPEEYKKYKKNVGMFFPKIKI